jgi:ribose 5-phosphate isomerase B
MRIAVGADHAGFVMKEQLSGYLRAHGHQVADLGTDNAEVSVDYPDFGAAVGRMVAAGEAELGLCACGTGIGIAMAANKVPGVRAAVVHDVSTATLARQHNHANVICFGGRTVGATTALDSLEAFLNAVPQGGRHDGRVEKLAALDASALIAAPGAS